jgi:hypothetical protein
MLPGGAFDISVGPGGHCWVVGGGGVPHYWKSSASGGGDWPVPPGSTLQGLSRIAVGPDGLAWAVGIDNQIIRRAGGEFPGVQWQTLPGGATDIGVGPGGHCWIVGGGGVPHYWESFASGDGDWPVPPGSTLQGLSRIAVGPDGLAWAVGTDNQIYRRTGGDFPGAQWETVTGAAIDIGIGANGAVWIVGTDHSVQYWTSNGWTRLSGMNEAESITVGPDGQPWVVGVKDTLWRWMQYKTEMLGVLGLISGWWGGEDPAPLAIFVGEVVFECSSPESLDMTSPPWFLSDWLAGSGCPDGIGDLKAIADTPDGGVIAFFDSQYVIFGPDANDATKLTFQESGEITTLLPMLDPGMLPFDFAFNDRSGICAVKGDKSTILTKGLQYWSASPPQSAPFVGKIPDSWTSVDAMWLNFTSSTYYAFAGGDFVSWTAESRDRSPEQISQLFNWIPTGRQRGLPDGYNIDQIYSQHGPAMRAANDALRDVGQSFKAAVDELGWYHGPSHDLEVRLDELVRTDPIVQKTLQKARTDGYACIYAGFQQAVGLIASVNWGTGMYVSADGQHSMAVASLGGGGGLSIGGSTSYGMGYFLRTLDQLVGGNFVIFGSLGVFGGVQFGLYFDSQGFAGFSVALGVGVDFSGELGGVHTWDMGQWHANP